MDLSSLNPQKAAEAGAFLQLEHPVTGELLRAENGEPIGMVVLGADSSAFRRRVAEQANARLERFTKRKATVTVERQQREECELLASVVVECRNMVIDGEAVTPRTIADAMLANAWIKEQVDAFVGRRENFTRSAQLDFDFGRGSSDGGTPPPSEAA